VFDPEGEKLLDRYIAKDKSREWTSNKYKEAESHGWRMFFKEGIFM
jgi:hypothetical protein